MNAENGPVYFFFWLVKNFVRSRGTDLQQARSRSETYYNYQTRNMLNPNLNASRPNPLVEFNSKRRADNNAGRPVPEFPLDLNSIKEDEDDHHMSSGRNQIPRPKSAKNKFAPRMVESIL